MTDNELTAATSPSTSLSSPSSTLFLQVTQARGLAPKDTDGFSDPYCIIGFSNNDTFGDLKKCIRSETQFRTLSPSWKRAVFSLGENAAHVRVEVWDKDYGPEDTFLGYTEIEHEAIKEEEVWVPLRARSPADGTITGEIQVKISKENNGHDVSVMTSWARPHEPTVQNELREKWKAEALQIVQQPYSADVEKKLLVGDVDVDLPLEKKKVVRLFTSSTFTDTELERNYLMKEVYPYLKTLCGVRQYEFEIVDMRWGVRAEASDSHETSDLCMSELFKCLKYSTGPAFISFLCNKYGYRPFPNKIDKPELDSIWQAIKEVELDKFFAALTKNSINFTPEIREEAIAHKEVSTLWQFIAEKFENISEVILNQNVLLIPYWFRLDTNQVPPFYFLMSKKGAKNWWTMFSIMQLTLRNGAKCLHKKEQIKYIISVTEEEVHNGILNNPNRDVQALSFRRIIKDVAASTSKNQKKFIDLDDNSKVDEEAVALLAELRDQKLPAQLDNSLIWTSFADGQEVGLDDDQGKRASYMQNFGNLFCENVTNSILTAFAKAKVSPSPLFDEVWEHHIFRKGNQLHFLERPEITAKISKFIENTDFPRSPFVIYGGSGCGKSSFMGRTTFLAKELNKDKNVVVIYRFCGITGSSSTNANLLQSVVQHIIQVYNFTDEKVPSDFKELVPYFPELLAKIPSSQPLFLLLDSLDQLAEDGTGVRWIPFKLPETTNVKIIISHLPYLLDSVCSFHPFPKDERFFIEIPELGQHNGAQIAKHFLRAENRQLTEDQENHLLANFAKCSAPLYLRIACDLARKWNSFTKIEECILAPSMYDLINIFFDWMERKHGKILVSYAFGYISAAKDGVTNSELEDLLSCTEEVLSDVYEWWTPPIRRLPPLLWVRIRSDTGSYISERGSGGLSVVGWFHRQFKEAARDRYLAIPPLTKVSTTCQTQQEYLHKNLASYFAGEWSSPNEVPYLEKETNQIKKADRVIPLQPLQFSEKAFNLRKLIELPYHLTKSAPAQPADLYSTTLLNFKFIMAKCEAGLLNDLQSDFAEAISIGTPQTAQLQEMSDFILRNRPAIYHYPKMVLQIALNQPDHQVITQIARRDLTDDYTYLEWTNKPQALDHLLLQINVEADYVQFIDNQEKIISLASSYGKVYIHDAKTGAEITRVAGARLFMKPNSDDFITVYKNNFTMYNHKDYSTVFSVPREKQALGLFSADGKYFLTSSDRLKLYDESGKLVWEILASEVEKLAVQKEDDPDFAKNERIFEEYFDRPEEHVIWDLRFSVINSKLHLYGRLRNFMVAFSKDLKDKSPIVGKKFQKKEKIIGQNNNIAYIYLRSNKKLVVKSIDITTGAIIARKHLPLSTADDQPISAEILSHNEKIFVRVYSYFLNGTTLDEIAYLGEDYDILCVAVHKDQFILGYYSGDVKVVEINTKKEIAKFKSQMVTLRNIAISATGTKMIVCGESDSFNVYSYPPPPPSENTTITLGREVNAFAVSPDNTKIAMGVPDPDKPIDTKKLGFKQPVSLYDMDTLTYSDDGALLLALTKLHYREHCVYDTQANKIAYKLEDVFRDLYSVDKFDFIPNTHNLIGAGRKGTFGTFDATAKTDSYVQIEEIEAYQVMCSPDGRIFVYDANKRITVLDTKFNTLAKLELYFMSKNSFLTTKDFIIAAGLHDARVWDINTYAQLFLFYDYLQVGKLSNGLVWFFSAFGVLRFCELSHSGVRTVTYVQLPVTEYTGRGTEVQGIYEPEPNKYICVTQSGTLYYLELKNYSK